MKKSLYFVVLLSLLFSLTACGNGGKTNATQTDPTDPPSAGTTVEPTGSSGEDQNSAQDWRESTADPVNLGNSGTSNEQPVVHIMTAGDVHFWSPNSTNHYVSEKMDLVSLQSICNYCTRTSAIYVRSENSALSAKLERDGRIIYTYNDSATEEDLWWKTQDVPEGVAFATWQDHATTYVATNFYPDIASGSLQDVEDGDPLYISRNETGLLLLYPDAAYLYKEGVGQRWDVKLHDGCFAVYDSLGPTRVYNGTNTIYKLYEDGASVALDNVVDAAEDTVLKGSNDLYALVVKDGTLTVHWVNAQRAVEIAASGVKDAQFACGTILYLSEDGYTYATKRDTYKDFDDIADFEHVRLGTGTIESYATAYEQYLRRDDTDRYLGQALWDFFDLCAAGEY